MVIISASGMAEVGRILHHLRNNIEDKKNTVLIVSWQEPHTLGRRLAERQPEVKIFGEAFKVRAEVVTIGGLSAHAGQTFLLDYAKATQASLKALYLVHGEEKSANPFMSLLRENGFDQVSYPDYRDSVEI
jgi:metallo-beta-lactamase family protein